MKFSELNLHPLLRANIEKLNFESCTPIQEQAIPIARLGKDVAGLAQTGTGKTAAFLIPIIDRLLWSLEAEKPEGLITVPFTEWKRRQFVLVLVPTRELAEQVQESAVKFLQGTGFSAVSIYGGTSYEKQIAAFKSGAEFVIATPGRLIDLYKEHVADLGQARAVIFDEADRMFDMGFKDDMKFILRRLPRDRQFLVFSATLNFDVLNVAYEFGADPVEVNISRDQAKAEHVKDYIFHCGQSEKPSHVLSVLKKHEPRQTIIFSNFKRNVERIARFLSQNGFPAVGISSLLTQAQRNRVMEQFKAENDRNILVATDLAARGLDILGVDMVINFELPDDPENYVHRIGRTGRAGAEGTAYSFVSDRDVDALSRIESYLKHKVEAAWLEDADIVKDFKPFPSIEDIEGRPSGGGRARGERGDGRRSDRGPRREGRGGGREGGRDGRRDGGRDGRRDGGRGPRPQGEGARADGGRGSRPQGEGARADGGRGPSEGQRREGRRPRPEGEAAGAGGQHRDRQSGRHRPEGRGPRPEQRDARGPRREGEQARGPGGSRGGAQKNQRRQGGASGPSTQAPRAGAPLAASGQKSIGKKVTGLLKKIFGK